MTQFAFESKSSLPAAARAAVRSRLSAAPFPATCGGSPTGALTRSRSASLDPSDSAPGHADPGRLRCPSQADHQRARRHGRADVQVTCWAGTDNPVRVDAAQQQLCLPAGTVGRAATSSSETGSRRASESRRSVAGTIQCPVSPASPISTLLPVLHVAGQRQVLQPRRDLGRQQVDAGHQPAPCASLCGARLARDVLRTGQAQVGRQAGVGAGAAAARARTRTTDRAPAAASSEAHLAAKREGVRRQVRRLPRGVAAVVIAVEVELRDQAARNAAQRGRERDGLVRQRRRHASRPSPDSPNRRRGCRSRTARRPWRAGPGPA